MDVPLQFQKQWMQALPRLLWELKHTHVSVTKVRLITASLLILDVVLSAMSTLLIVLKLEYIDATWFRDLHSYLCVQWQDICWSALVYNI